MKEIITLQFGTGANFMGSHFWNMQDVSYQPWFFNEDDGQGGSEPAAQESEIDSSHLYRVGQTETVSLYETTV